MADGSTTSYNFTLPEVGASEDTWGTKLNANWSLCDDLLDGTTAIAPNLTEGSWQVGGVAVTATAAELNLLDGVTATTAEINYVDGVTSNIQTQLDTKIDTAGTGFNKSGTTLNIDADLRDGITHIGRDTSDYIQIDANAMQFVINGGQEFLMESDGDFHADGDLIAYSATISDERLKTNIVGIENAVAKVSQLNGYTFEYKADGKISAGVIAQEVEAVLPEAVTEKLLPLKSDDGQEYKVVNYDALHGLLIEAVKELSARVEELEAK